MRFAAQSQTRFANDDQLFLTHQWAAERSYIST
jgi:hypothetical protein